MPMTTAVLWVLPKDLGCRVGKTDALLSRGLWPRGVGAPWVTLPEN